MSKKQKNTVTFAPRSRGKFKCNLCGTKISRTKTDGHRRSCLKLPKSSK